MRPSPRSVAIGQTAPGPNVMVASVIGWQLAGVAGLLVVTLSIVLPSSGLAVAIGRFVARHEEGATIALVRRALAPVALGFMLASSVVMTRAAWQGAGTLVVVATVAAMVVLTRLSPLWGIAGGAIAGLAAAPASLDLRGRDPWAASPMSMDATCRTAPPACRSRIAATSSPMGSTR